MRENKIVKRYYEPTPIFFRKLGDSLLGVSSMITVAAISEHVDWLAYTALGIGVIGKFLSNFFSDAIKEEQNFEG